MKRTYCDPLTEKQIALMNTSAKQIHLERSWRRKLKNIYLGYKYRLQDFLSKYIKIW